MTPYIVVDHPFVPFADSAPGVNNPRRPNSCQHCYFRKDLHPQPKPEPEPDPPREPGWEAQFAREACRTVGVDGSDLIAFSQHRADPGPVRRFYERDLIQDACEEAADLLNYVTWHADRARRTGEGIEDMQRMARVVAYLALAYHELTV